MPEAPAAPRILRTFSRDEQRFITFYVRCRDVARAAEAAGLDKRDAETIWRREDIRKKCAYQINLVEHEQAKLDAQANQLNVNFLDSHLVKLITDQKTHSHVRFRSVELGYKRVGAIRDGEFITAAQPSADGPKIYTASQTSTVRRTVTTEEITHTLPVETPKVIEAEVPQKRSMVEVLDF